MLVFHDISGEKYTIKSRFDSDEEILGLIEAKIVSTPEIPLKFYYE